MTYDYDEPTLDYLRITIPTHGVLVPIIKQKNTEQLIDGRHRQKIWEELDGKTKGIPLPVHYVETDNPEEYNQIINDCRRPWKNLKEREKLIHTLRGIGHSQRAIAKTMGVTEMTVRRDLTKGKAAAGATYVAPAAGLPSASVGQDGKKYNKPGTKEEIEEALALYKIGKSTSDIAKDKGRGVRTIRDWIAKSSKVETESPAFVGDNNVATITRPQINTQKEKEQLTPTGILSDLTKEFIKKESKEFGERIELLENAVKLSKQLDKLWKYVQQKHDKHGRPVARQDIEIASKVMIQNGTLANMAVTLGLPDDASYFDALFAIDALGKKISSCARRAIYLSGYSDTILP
jgi:transposase